MSMQSSNQIVLPSGWSVSGYRETSQANPAGQIVQGLVFTLSNATGGSTSVFIQNSLLGQVDAIQTVFDERIRAITAITG